MEEAASSSCADSEKCIEVDRNKGLWALKEFYPDEIPVFKGYDQPAFMYQKGYSYRCLICLRLFMLKKDVKVNLEEHLKAHKNMSTNMRDVWLRFCVFWTSLIGKPCINEQIFFKPNQSDSAMCMLCNKRINYIGVIEHFEKTYHVKQKKRFDIIEADSSLEIVKIPSDEEHNIKSAFEKAPEDRKDVLDSLECRFKPHLKFLEVVDDSVFCKCCNLQMSANIDVVHTHIFTDKHIENSRLKRGYFRALCGGCFCYFSQSKFFFHVKSCPGKRSNFEHFECNTCKVALFGDHRVFKFHALEVKRKQEFKFTDDLQKLLKNATRIAEDLEAESLRMLGNQAEINQIIHDLLAVVQRKLPLSKVYVFGSRLTGLGNNKTDLDLFYDIGGMYNGERYQDAQSQKLIVEEFGNYIRSVDLKVFKKVVCIPKARTPIVKLHHIPTNTDCDLSFRHGLSVENSFYIKASVLCQPKLKSLILFMKNYFKNVHMNDVITTYALSMMCLFIFQQIKLLPSLSEYYDLHSKGVLINGWTSIHYTQSGFADVARKYPETKIPFLSFLAGFFEFYSKVDFGNLVICPLIGGLLPKSSFQLVKLPDSMAAYVKQLPKEVFRFKSEICVQDPFDLSHNLTKAFAGAKNLQKLLKTSLDFMRETHGSKNVDKMLQNFNFKYDCV